MLLYLFFCLPADSEVHIPFSVSYWLKDRIQISFLPCRQTAGDSAPVYYCHYLILIMTFRASVLLFNASMYAS